MFPHLRVARPVTALRRSATLYQAGLGLDELGSFENHEGFDGIILGQPGAGYHLELTFCRHHPVKPTPTPEDLLVLYLPETPAFEARCNSMRHAGFREVMSFNPYWQTRGCTFEDFDGYRVVIAHLHGGG